DEKADELVEPELRPLVEAAFERHQAIQMGDDDGGWQIEEHDGQQPEDDVRRPQLGRNADPRQADDEEDLREREVGDAELAPQRRAARFDLRGIGAEGRHRAFSLPAMIGFIMRLDDYLSRIRQPAPPAPSAA